MKKVSIVIPTYNEEDNVKPIVEAVIEEVSNNLEEYDYEVLIIDNNSQDNTRALIRAICRENKKVKAIFNEKIVRHIMDYFRQVVTALSYFALISKTP